VPAPRLNRDIVASMLDLMPSPRLVFRQWDRHGVCSGLPPSGYFEAVRKARAVIKIPAEFLDLKAPLAVPSRPGEFHPEPLTDSGREPLDSSGSCHRTKAAAFR
jgi:ribonuclease T2